ncbi:hypothetical protein [uncultured Shewanella sp.]|uniref:hypothetical protein n=1 Tax=uncultured Shewanella sp. TaxID=173975 RepID=UPI00261E2EB5|nr:hypothetical protein [uncultured Shewanella sp.]
MKNKIKYTLLLISTIYNVSTHAFTMSDIDFENRIENDSFLFAPVYETTSNKGAFWYKDIKQKVIGPSNSSWGIKKITVRAFPESHVDNNYSDFILDNNIIDVRENILPDDAILCEATEGLVEQLNRLEIYYTLNPNLGNYPSLCSLQLKYQANNEEKENEIVEYIKNNNVIKINYSISSSVTPSVLMNVPDLVSLLVEDDVISFDDNEKIYTGDAFEIFFYSSKYPSEFYRDDLNNGDELQFIDWKRFIDLYDISTSAQMSIDEDVANEVIEIVPNGNGEEILSVVF